MNAITTDNDILALADAIRARRERERIERETETNRALVGQCFRYRNSYSCPEEEGDYWWLYIRVDRLDEYGQPRGLMFQTDVHGKIEIYPDYGIGPSMLDSPVSREIFARELEVLKTKIAVLSSVR